ncbi:hypothetical protein DFH08DRAFT_823496 [Mycena albidolilacea]|uniref:Uncharacterized protein n=1 Tax=Mycena albidolilacea TaxID=1033008 RepID=A0AAD7EB81_9AGAR|nr:hypothetical protein DFH08DRAFT_823496 [Mycena albidolilacea]
MVCEQEITQINIGYRPRHQGNSNSRLPPSCAGKDNHEWSKTALASHGGTLPVKLGERLEGDWKEKGIELLCAKVKPSASCYGTGSNHKHWAAVTQPSPDPGYNPRLAGRIPAHPQSRALTLWCHRCALRKIMESVIPYMGSEASQRRINRICPSRRRGDLNPDCHRAKATTRPTTASPDGGTPPIPFIWVRSRPNLASCREDWDAILLFGTAGEPYQTGKCLPANKDLTGKRK